MHEQTNSTWKIDPGHSNLQFNVKHMAIANILGIFNVFDGKVVSHNEDFSDAEIIVEVDVSSINTNNKVRDEHLCSDFFFDTAKYPKIIFKGHLIKVAIDSELVGELTIRDVTTKIRLSTKITGTGLGRWGDTRIGFEIGGAINRKECGLTFNVLTDSGSVIVGDEVKLHMDIELIKEQSLTVC